MELFHIHFVGDWRYDSESMFSTQTLIEISSILFIAAVFRTAFGFGEALIAVPLLSLFLPIKLSAPLAVLASIVIALIAVVRDLKHIHFSEAKKLIIATVFGLPFGVIILRYVPEGVVKTTLGILLLLFSTFSLLRPQFFHLTNDRPVWLFGFVAGVTGGSYGMNGPPLAIYGAARRWPPERFRATIQAYFLPASAMGMTGYYASGIWTVQVNGLFLKTLPAVLLGAIAGRLLSRKMHPTIFAKALHVGLIITACTLIGQAGR